MAVPETSRHHQAFAVNDCRIGRNFDCGVWPNGKDVARMYKDCAILDWRSSWRRINLCVNQSQVRTKTRYGRRECPHKKDGEDAAQSHVSNIRQGARDCSSNAGERSGGIQWTMPTIYQKGSQHQKSLLFPQRNLIRRNYAWKRRATVGHIQLRKPRAASSARPPVARLPRSHSVLERVRYHINRHFQSQQPWTECLKRPAEGRLTLNLPIFQQPVRAPRPTAEC
jgi:hypothetical protein